MILSRRRLLRGLAASSALVVASPAIAQLRGVLDVTDSAFAGGAKADFIILRDASIDVSVNPHVVNSPSANFVSSDVGKVIAVQNAGPSGHALIDVITSRLGPTSVQTATAASASVSSVLCNYGTDDTDALNAAAHAVDKGNMLWLPPGYYGATSIDATGLIGIRMEGTGGADNQGPGAKGCVILPLAEGPALMDMCGSLGVRMTMLQLGHRWQAVEGSNALLMAPTNTLACGGFNMEQVAMSGRWSKGAWYGYGVTTLFAKFVSVGQQRLGSVAARFGCDNDYGVSSLYRTIATGYQGCGDLALYEGGMATNLASGGSNTAPTLYLRGTGSMRAFGQKFNNSGVTGQILAVSVNGTNPSLTCYGCNFYPEDGGAPNYNVYVPDGSAFDFKRDAATGFVYAIAPKGGGGTLTPPF